MVLLLLLLLLVVVVVVVVIFLLLLLLLLLLLVGVGLESLEGLIEIRWLRKACRGPPLSGARMKNRGSIGWHYFISIR